MLSEVFKVLEVLLQLPELWRKLRRVAATLRHRWWGLPHYVPVAKGRRRELTELMLAQYLAADGLAAAPAGTQGFSWNDLAAPMLTLPDWVPPQPLPLERLDAGLVWSPIKRAAPRLQPGFAGRMCEELGAKLDDNPIYRLLEAKVGDGVPAFTCGLATYFDHIESGEVLVWEAAKARMKAGKKQGAALVKAMHGHMPLRGRTHPFDFSSRSCCIGVDTLTVIGFRERPPTFLLHERSSGKRGPAEGGDSLHVVPAGSFQPNTAKDLHHAAEYSVRRNVVRECAEELFDKEALIHASQKLAPDRIFDKDPELLALKTMFEDGGISQWYLGSFIDPLTLKMEILTMLLVDGDRLSDTFDALRDGWEGHHDQYPFNLEELAELQAMPRMLPAGQAALILAMQHHEWIQARLTEQLSQSAAGQLAA